MTSLADRALTVHDDNIALGNETFEAEGALFVRNLAVRDIRDANHVARITASTPDAIDRLLARADKEFAGVEHRRYDCDYRTPPEFEARLALDGYTGDTALVSVLEGDLQATPQQFEIVPVDSEERWQAYADLSLTNWQGYRTRQGLAPELDVGRMMVHAHRLKCPPVRYWLGLIDGVPRGFFSSWDGHDGVGQVEDLYVDAEFRHRGLATALIAHCVDDVRSRGIGPVAIVSDPNDTPKHMYAAMGWRPVAIAREWRRTSSP